MCYFYDVLKLGNANGQNYTGTTIPKLFQYVEEFYKQHRQRRYRIDRLCDHTFLNSENHGQTNPSDDDAEYYSTQTLDTDLKKKIWGSLLNEADFLVGRNNEGKGVELEEIEAAYTTSSDKSANKAKEAKAEDSQNDIVKADNDTDRQHEASVMEEKPQKAIKWKVYASIERRWRALAGHGIDHKKVCKSILNVYSYQLMELSDSTKVL